MTGYITGVPMGRKSIANERRDQIIEAFYRCTVNQGLAASSIRKIAEEAKVQPSTLHHYFESREEIIEEAVVYFTNRIFKDFNHQMKSLNHSGDKLSRGIEFIFSKGMINADYTGFFLECCVAARNNENIRKTLALLFNRFREAILGHLEQMDGFSKLSGNDRHMLSTLIVALHEGIELQWFADETAIRLDQVLETTFQLIRFFVQEKTKELKGELL